jgi:hypothetical protein
MTELRQNERLYNRTTIRLTTAYQKSVDAFTLDVSNGGLLIVCDLMPFPKIGDVITVQSNVFPEAPIKNAVVRRIAGAGKIGVEFVYN